MTDNITPLPKTPQTRISLAETFSRHWERILVLQEAIQFRNRFFNIVMAILILSLFFAIWLEPSRGTIGAWMRLSPSLILVVSQFLTIGILLYGLGSRYIEFNSFLVFAANFGLLMLCLYPLVDNVYQLFVIPDCPIFNSHMVEGTCRLTAWHSILLLQVAALYILRSVVNRDDKNALEAERLAKHHAAIQYIGMDSHVAEKTDHSQAA